MLFGKTAEPVPKTDPGSAKDTFTFDLSSYDAVVAMMAFHMESDAEGEDAKWLRRLNKVPVGGDLTAYFRFIDLVLSKWDYKSAIRNCIQLSIANIPGNNTTFWGTPIPGDNEFLYFYDIWTNIHYGFVGRSCGFAEWELGIGSKIHDNVKSFLSEKESGDDTVSIEAGFKLFEHGAVDAVTLQDVIQNASKSWTEGVTKYRLKNLKAKEGNPWSENSFGK